VILSVAVTLREAAGSGSDSDSMSREKQHKQNEASSGNSFLQWGQYRCMTKTPCNSTFFS
jgi:hypothetical protein